MNVLVMGCGEIGALVATSLWQDGHLVSVIDTRSDRLRRLPRGLQQEAVLGDGTQEEDLRRAGIESMDAFVAVSSEDVDNIFAAQMASARVSGGASGLPHRRRGPVPTVCRAGLGCRERS